MSESIDAVSNIYPSRFRDIKGMPQKIYYKGSWSTGVCTKSLGVVGSRRVSCYGTRVLKELFYRLKESDVVVVSGFTLGVDSLSHELSINSSCKTIAVMPCGVDVIQPVCNIGLYHNILKNGGLIISEYEDGFMPQKWTFPKRNRIIAAISRALLVVEASLNSGSMITAEFAFKYGTKVFSVPGDIYCERSMGTNQLIKMGASVYTCPEQIVEFLKLNTAYQDGISRGLGGSAENKILAVLKQKNISFDELVQISGMESSAISSLLINLELQNKIEEKGGIYYLL